MSGFSMTPERWQKIRELFHAVLELDSSKRARYLEEACAEDASLRQEVEALLSRHGRAEGFLESPVMEGTTCLFNWPESPIAGQRYGSYRVIRELGEGGMGVVYLAQQEEPIQRRVALKIIKLGMDTREIVGRFQSERQALAMMEHPNIARVLDAGATKLGRPYFVMEYVPGVPITQYCDDNQLSNRERLKLFSQVCQAIHHAHQKGIIHRDIKPSNVLVAVVDGQPTPKVIDFGVAKAVNQRFTERTVFTELGILIGTPEYMSPEQAEVTPLDLDTRSDIYSLGVLLYELVVGALPFDSKMLREAGDAEMRRIIREVEPPTPTTRLRTLGARAADVARRHRTDPMTLERQVRGDLDWIAMKAMEKNPTRRYASASEFAADVERHLHDEPVLAGPPSFSYRLGKLMRRNKGLVTAVVAAAGCLMTGLVLSTVMYVQERSSRREADHQRLVAQWKSYVADLSAAELHLRANEVAEARDRLLDCRPELRGWEWRHLFLRSDYSLATLYTVEDFAVEEEYLTLYRERGGTFAFSADGSRVFWNSRHTLHDWDTSNYMPAARYSGFGTILTVAPHGERVVAKSYKSDFFGMHIGPTDNILRVLEPASRKEVAAFTGHKEEADMAAFNREGTRIVSASRDGVVALWEAESGKTLASVRMDRGSVTSLAFSANSKTVAVGATDGAVRVWDPASGRIVWTLKGHAGPITALTFAAGGPCLASASSDNTVRLWDSSSGRLMSTISSETGPVLSVAFSPEGNRLVFGTQSTFPLARSNSAHLWRVGGCPRSATEPETSRVATLTGRGGPVASVAFSPDGTRMFTADGGVVRVWSTETLAGGQLLRDAKVGAGSVQISPNGVIVANAGRGVRVWNTVSGKIATIAVEKDIPLPGISFSPDSASLAVGLSRGRVRIYDAASGALVKELQVAESENLRHSRSLTYRHAVKYSPDGKRLAAGWDKTVRIWDTGSWTPIADIQLQNKVNGLGFSPDGRLIATAAGDPSVETVLGPFVQVWNANSGKLVLSVTRTDDSTLNTTVRAWNRAQDVVFSPDGQRLASVEAPGIQIWDAHTGARIASLSLNGGGSVSVVFSPDGSRIFTTSGGTIQIWDATSLERLLSLGGDEGRVFSISLSKDGNKLVSGSSGSTFLVTRLGRSAFGTGGSTSLRVWETRSAYNPEAEALVNKLYSDLHFAGDVLERLKTDPNLDEELRGAALRLVQRIGDYLPSEHRFAAFELAKASGKNMSDYRLALRHAQLACDLAPWYWAAFNARGIAQYRTGAYPDALSSLEQAAEMRVQPNVTTVAFLAMTYRKLGQKDRARSALATARRLLQERDTKDEELEAIMHEAESVVQ